MRVALYARVSTEEQAKHGISIEAQVDSLRSWASTQGHIIIGEYIDNGVSARISPSKRPQLQNLLNDISRLKTELVAFTKLDRWTRNVKGYYQVQEVLDKYGVAWNAIQERYETETVNGRFTVNVLLAVSEQEADRTAERIKSVFDHKIAIGQVVNNSVPPGLRVDGKKIVPDEFATAVEAAFQCYADTGSRNAVQQVMASYGKKMSLQSIAKMLRNRLYIGEYRDNPHYCEPILSRELFFRVQRDMESRATYRAPSGRIYLFSGLIFCAECGRRFIAIHTKYTYYHCQGGHSNVKDCRNSIFLREDTIEQSVVDALAEVVRGKLKEVKPKPQRRPDKASVERKLARLRDLYVDGDISKAQYKARRDTLAAMIQPEAEPKAKIIFGDNFAAEYAERTSEQKKALMRAVIEKIVVHPDGAVDVIFAENLAF